MPQRKSGERIDLDLTLDERNLLLDDEMFLDDTFVEAIRQTPPDAPIRLTLEELEQLADELAAESKHSEDGQLDQVYDRIQHLLGLHAADE